MSSLYLDSLNYTFVYPQNNNPNDLIMLLDIKLIFKQMFKVKQNKVFFIGESPDFRKLTNICT